MLEESKRLFNLAPWAIVGALAWPTIALAEPIRLVRDGREAGAVFRVSGLDFTNRTQSSSDVLRTRGTFSNNTTTVSGQGELVSSIADLTHMSGTGYASSAFSTALPVVDYEYASGYADFLVEFELDRSYAFDFTGIFSSSGASTHSAGNWSAFLSNVFSETPTFFDGWPFDRIEPGVTRLSASGVLAPGNWYFGSRIFAGSDGFSRGTSAANGAFTFTLDLTAVEPVPEPATFGLVATGVLGAVQARRRRKKP